jgi:O-antigen/teichoic acid export membrane protein
MARLLSYIRDKTRELGFRRYAAHISWMLFARILTMLVALVATSYIARMLGPTLYGELSYALSFTALFGFIAALGIDQVLYREILLKPEKRNEFMGTAVALRVASGVLAVIVCVGTALLLGVGGLSLLLIAILATTFVFGAGILLGQEFQADAEAKYPSILAIGITVGLNVFKIAAIAFGFGVIGLAFVLALEPIFYIVGLWYLRHRRYGSLRAWKVDPSLVRMILIDATPLMFVSAFYMVYARIDQVLIKHMVGATSVGHYDAAVRISELWYFVPAIIITGLIPAIANAKRVDDALYKKRAKKLLFYMAGAAVLVAGINVVFADLFVSIVFGASFAASAHILMWYVWSNVGSALVHVSQQVLILENMTKHILFGTLCGMVVNVALCLWLIPLHGMAGAAVASIVSYAVPFLTLFLMKRTRAFLLSIIFA